MWGIAWNFDNLLKKSRNKFSGIKYWKLRVQNIKTNWSTFCCKFNELTKRLRGAHLPFHGYVCFLHNLNLCEFYTVLLYKTNYIWLKQRRILLPIYYRSSNNKGIKQQIINWTYHSSTCGHWKKIIPCVLCRYVLLRGSFLKSLFIYLIKYNPYHKPNYRSNFLLINLDNGFVFGGFCGAWTQRRSFTQKVRSKMQSR